LAESRRSPTAAIGQKQSFNALRHISNTQTAFGDLFDCFDLGFFGVTLVSDSTS
jgi:hypothetical protein